jgi:hypothetical protein
MTSKENELIIQRDKRLIENIQADQAQLRQASADAPSRFRACAITKLDEAIHWLDAEIKELEKQ